MTETYVSDTSAKAPYIDAIPASRLFVDPAYQRDEQIGRVAFMADNFDIAMCGVLEVSHRGEHRYAILDGQHRWSSGRVALASDDVPDVPFMCRVHDGLTPGEEAQLFHDLNVDRKALTWYAKWKARRVAGDLVVLEIERILARHALVIGSSPRTGFVASGAALEEIVEAYGPSMLDAVLVILTSAWRTNRSAFDAALLTGVALVLHVYGEELDTDRLVVQLSSTLPSTVRGQAIAMRGAGVARGALSRLVAAQIVVAYNATRSGKRLEDFLSRVPAGSRPTRRGRSRGEARPIELVEVDSERIVSSRNESEYDLAGDITNLAAIDVEAVSDLQVLQDLVAEPAPKHAHSNGHAKPVPAPPTRRGRSRGEARPIELVEVDSERIVSSRNESEYDLAGDITNLAAIDVEAVSDLQVLQDLVAEPAPKHAHSNGHAKPVPAPPTPLLIHKEGPNEYLAAKAVPCLCGHRQLRHYNGTFCDDCLCNKYQPAPAAVTS